MFDLNIEHLKSKLLKKDLSQVSVKFEVDCLKSWPKEANTKPTNYSKRESQRSSNGSNSNRWIDNKENCNRGNGYYGQNELGSFEQYKGMKIQNFVKRKTQRKDFNKQKFLIKLQR